MKGLALGGNYISVTCSSVPTQCPIVRNSTTICMSRIPRTVWILKVRTQVYILSLLLATSLSINITERKQVLVQACHLAHLSVSLPVCPEGVPWQNGWLDLDAIWGGEWVGRGMGVLDGDPHLIRRRRGIGDFLPHWFEWCFWMYFCIWLMCEKLTIFPYGNVGNICSLAFWIYSFEIEVGIMRNFQKCTNDFTKKSHLAELTLPRWQ